MKLDFSQAYREFKIQNLHLPNKLCPNAFSKINRKQTNISDLFKSKFMVIINYLNITLNSQNSNFLEILNFRKSIKS